MVGLTARAAPGTWIAGTTWRTVLAESRRVVHRAPKYGSRLNDDTIYDRVTMEMNHRHFQLMQDLCLLENHHVLCSHARAESTTDYR